MCFTCSSSSKTPLSCSLIWSISVFPSWRLFELFPMLAGQQLSQLLPPTRTVTQSDPFPSRNSFSLYFLRVCGANYISLTTLEMGIMNVSWWKWMLDEWGMELISFILHNVLNYTWLWQHFNILAWSWHSDSSMKRNNSRISQVYPAVIKMLTTLECMTGVIFLLCLFWLMFQFL